MVIKSTREEKKKFVMLVKHNTTRYIGIANPSSL